MQKKCYLCSPQSENIIHPSIKNSFMKVLIKVGVALNLLIGLGHLLCLAALDKIFVIYGISDVMNRIAQYGAYWPCIITILIAVAFFVVALYGLSVLKVIPRLPLQTTAMTTIVVVFSGRVIWGLTMLIPHFTWLEMSSTGVALLLAICYLPYLCSSKVRG